MVAVWHLNQSLGGAETFVSSSSGGGLARTNCSSAPLQILPSLTGSDGSRSRVQLLESALAVLAGPSLAGRRHSCSTGGHYLGVNK